MPTVLRITGPFEVLSPFLHQAPLPFSESIASRKQRERNDSPAQEACTFNFTVSEADGDRLPQQIEEAESFLQRNRDAVRSLRELAGLESMSLDFSWSLPRTSLGQRRRFPRFLLNSCSELGIDLDVSVYLVSPDDEEPWRQP